MNLDRKSAKPISSSHIHLTLPIKITGIVFWGMVLVGLLVAAFLLNMRENELLTQYQVDAILLSHELEDALEQAHNEKQVSDKLNMVFQSRINNDSFEAVTLSYPGSTLELGERLADQNKYSLRLHTHQNNTYLNNKTVELTVFAPNMQRAISSIRKNVLILTGAIIFFFGFVLQKILHRVLSNPFLNMVHLAENFANGDEHIRFDETRADEFGYLAKFINQALDSILEKQHALESSQQELFEEKERAEVTLQSIIDGVITTTANGKIQYMNPIAERMSGQTNKQAHGVIASEVIRFVDENSGSILPNPIENCLLKNSDEELASHAAMLGNNNKLIPVQARAAPMCNDEGKVIGAVMVFQDVSHARHLSRQLSYQASHDSLTNLYNRHMFEEHLQASLLNVQEEDRHHALCYIDLDQFKIVNDTCGHMAGDELLRQLATLLHDCIREDDMLARLGGDEFGVLLENCNLTDAAIIANTIRQSVKDFRFVWQNRSFEIGASIGLVGINAENVDMPSIMAAADVACYVAKDSGRNLVHVYEHTDEALAERQEQMHWANHLLEALENNQLILFQQPVISLNPEYSPRHCEALLRLQGDNGKIIYPNAFIPAAERYSIMPRIDRWVIHTIFKAMSEHCMKHEPRIISINLSGTSLTDDGLLDFILTDSKAYNINFNNVCFEITETAAISNIRKAARFMEKLKQTGCQFALDDFGSGLSSFAYLKTLPVDYIKIDSTFVTNISNDPIDRAMVEAIVRLGKIMQIKTVAEGVEDAETLSLLKELGVDFAQGYHLGRPTQMKANIKSAAQKAKPTDVIV